MYSRIGNHFATIVSTVSGLVALALLFEIFFDVVEFETKVLAVFLGLFTLWFFGAYFLTVWKAGRSIQYVEAIKHLNYAISEVNSLERKQPEPDAGEIINAFETFCDQVANAFSLMIGHQIAVCIKINQTTNDSGVALKTLCRDRTSVYERAHADTKSTELGIEHELQRNTAFKASITKTERYYVSNRLPWVFNYENTSFEVWGGEPETGNLWRRWKTWPLPYKSTIVAPIEPLKSTESAGSSSPAPIGYLCLDSPRVRAFRPSVEAQIIRGLADDVYNTLEKLKDLV